MCVFFQSKNADLGELNPYYKISIGSEECKIISINNKEIRCEPPKTKPDGENSNKKFNITVSLQNRLQFPQQLKLRSPPAMCVVSFINGYDSQTLISRYQEEFHPHCWEKFKIYSFMTPRTSCRHVYTLLQVCSIINV